MPKQLSRKRVACLEGRWHDDLFRPLTVRRILQTAADIAGFEFAHLTCNTREEFTHNLGLLRGTRMGILYLAFHGQPGRLELPAALISLEELAELMRSGFKGWVVHLGTCSTMGVSEDRLKAFKERTGAGALIGYKEDVDWLEAASVEMLLLEHLHRYKTIGRMWSEFNRRYNELVRLTGLTIYR